MNWIPLIDRAPIEVGTRDFVMIAVRRRLLSTCGPVVPVFYDPHNPFNPSIPTNLLSGCPRCTIESSVGRHVGRQPENNITTRTPERLGRARSFLEGCLH